MQASCRIHTDGGARGNPGPAAIGGIVEPTLTEASAEARTVKPVLFHRYIGIATNNVAEYTAVIEAYRIIHELEMKYGITAWTITFFLDSQLVVNQLNGLFKVKNQHLRDLMFHIRSLEQQVDGQITYAAVRRELNAVADSMVNKSLDEQILR